MEILILKTFKFYDRKGRRLAIFATPISKNTELNMFVLTCSKKDIFTKNFASTVYSCYMEGTDCVEMEVHPQIFRIPIENNQPGRSFIDYCNHNYYRLVDTNVETTVKRLVPPLPIVDLNLVPDAII